MIVGLKGRSNHVQPAVGDHKRVTTSTGNKYGGLAPKKKPLISKTGLYASKVQELIKNQRWL
uniref:Uncharacterized protein n=1 Tax=Solanum lycopersicum TaxID=4081 RepID=A0A3Q7EF34_SOLLC